MTIGYGIFARYDSRRLPGKALADLAGQPMLARVIERIRLAAEGRPIIVATSDRPDDDGIAALAQAEGVGLFRGSVDDVLGRALALADDFGLTALVRICGDSPFMDPALCRRMVALAESGDFDLVTNVFPRGFPPGCSIEVIATGALRRMVAEAGDPAHREHMTSYIYQNPDSFRIHNVAPDRPWPAVALTVDEPADLERARRVFALADGQMDRLDLAAIVDLITQDNGAPR